MSNKDVSKDTGVDAATFVHVVPFCAHDGTRSFGNADLKGINIAEEYRAMSIYLLEVSLLAESYHCFPR